MLPRHRISLWQCSSQQYKGQVILHQIQQGLLRSYCLLVVFCQAPGICRWHNHCLHKVPLIYHFWEVLQSQLPQHKVGGSLQQVAVSHTRSCHCCNFFKDTPLCNHWIKKLHRCTCQSLVQLYFDHQSLNILSTETLQQLSTLDSLPLHTQNLEDFKIWVLMPC